MDVVDLSTYRVDCSRKQEQIAFIKSQMPGPREQRMNMLAMTSVVGWANSAANGTFTEDRAMFDNKQVAIAKVILHQLNQYCWESDMPKKPQGCTHVDESMTSGASNGTRCYEKNNKTPKSTRWEATVDN